MNRLKDKTLSSSIKFFYKLLIEKKYVTQINMFIQTNN